jgi:glycyl-tRNA synthetase
MNIGSKVGEEMGKELQGNYDKIIRLALERGFFYPCCEIYADAPAGFWDYGPLGLALKNRYIELWRRELIRRDEMLEIDGAQTMSRSVFIASGHLESFADPITKCKECGSIIRIDNYIQEKIGIVVPERLKNEEYDELIEKYKLRCPSCQGSLSKVTRFNMMFRLTTGPSGEEAYLRPETCQSIFVDFLRISKTMRIKLPIAIAQFGKSFRNEVSPRQSLIRLREFYQAEIEIFFNPNKANELKRYEKYKDYKLRLSNPKGDVKLVSCEEAIKRQEVPNRLIAYYLALLQSFYEKTGIDMDRSRFRRLTDEEKAFYAEVAYDFEVKTSLGWIELVACNYRTDYDLKRHSEVSKKDLAVRDNDEKVLPHIFELSMGVDRSLYCILEHSYTHDGKREYLRLKPYLAPIQVGVFPLVSKDGLPERAIEVYEMVKLDFDCFYDDSGSIGRRYRRLDEIGTPYCVTIDYQTLNDDTVTIRDRDSMKQERIKINSIKEELRKRLAVT